MQVMSKKIVVLGTGGTIAGRASDAMDTVGYVAGQVGVADLIAAVPGLAQWPLVIEQIAQLDSKDMDFSVWQSLLARCAYWLGQDDVQGVVITHGTDTLEETAFFLHQVLAPAKPVVLTCAMRPASAPAPDGPQNLLDAMAVVSAPSATGVTVVCAGVVHSAVDVQKVHTYRLDAFSSGDDGPLGYVEATRFRRVRDWPLPTAIVMPDAIEKIASIRQWPRVDIVTSHAGADGQLVRLLVADGVQGIVVAATGNGTVHTVLSQALVAAQAQGVKVLRATRCAQGRVLEVASDPISAALGLSPVKARIALMLALLGEPAHH